MTALVAAAPTGAGACVLRGRATTALREPLLAPASGLPCVHWRMRIIETVAPGLEFVHELCSPGHFELICGDGPEARSIRVTGATARLLAPILIHQPGSPGARAIAAELGCSGVLQVEEMLIRPDEPVEADGVLLETDTAAGPSRRVSLPLELVEASLRVPARPRSVSLLPWAVGTGVLLLGALGGTAFLLRKFEAAAEGSRQARPAAVLPAGEIGPARVRTGAWP